MMLLFVSLDYNYLIKVRVPGAYESFSQRLNMIIISFIKMILKTKITK